MSEEIKETKECKCFCHSEGFRKFLTVALGTFVGVFCALSLFAALHKPPMMAPYGMMPRPMMGCPCHMHHHHFGPAKFQKCDFKKMPPKGVQNRTPFEAPRPEVDD